MGAVSNSCAEPSFADIWLATRSEDFRLSISDRVGTCLQEGVANHLDRISTQGFTPQDKCRNAAVLLVSDGTDYHNEGYRLSWLRRR